MATYTSNYNLGKPEPTDPFGNFRQLFNDNMDEIDANLGGGGGGGGAYYGFAIDENNKLFEGTINDFNQSLSYTATEDGIALCWYKGSSGTWQFLSVNGTFIRLGGNGTDQPVSYSIPIRKGDTVSARYQSGSESCYFWLSVYGIKQGTSGIFTPIIYSDTERKIGIWRDNKPLYQRTFAGLSLSCVSANQTYSTNILWSGYENVVGSEIIDIYGQSLAGSVVYTGTPAKLAVNLPMANRTVYAVTIRYTKTTDVAGSGDWNTDGVPTVHYSTSEQVVGTYLGKPLYKRMWDNLAISITANTWANTGISATDIDVIVDGTMQDDNKQKIGGTIGFMSSHTYIGVYPQIGNRDLSSMTVLYTKTTD